MIDTNHVVALIRETAEREILPRFRKLEKHEVGEKTAGEIVTIADREAEKRLGAGLEKLLPGSVTVGEEGASDRPEILEKLNGDAPVWVIDPVDGTKNFAQGGERFATIVALCYRQRTLVGWIHDPLSGSTLYASKGEGAWMDGSRVHVSSPPPATTDMRGAFYGPKANIPDTWRGRTIRYGCVGHEYIDLALGRLDFARYRKLKPWDHAAGVLIHEEAGGYSALSGSGEAYSPLPYQEENSLILAPDAEKWTELSAVFAP
ncbi:MAG: inositol monophosphatase [Rhodospirillales bacterium]|nr:inositol monophosphatase [Rhodospirillales bacterium]